MTERRASILLVEDDEHTRRAVAANLEGHGYGVRAAADGEEALVLWELRRPDLILLDLGLPGIDGKGVLRRVRRDATTPVIVLSARGEERDKVEALDGGADDYLAKPFGMAELHARCEPRCAGPWSERSTRAAWSRSVRCDSTRIAGWYRSAESSCI